MSRFKLFAVMQMALMSIMQNKKLTSDEKQSQTRVLNKQSGGLLFAGSIMPSIVMNQRQRRKLQRQQPHGWK